MNNTLFRITYRVQAHHVRAFEEILAVQILPLIQELGIQPPTVWKGFVGDAGEYMELWEFDSVSDFEEKWRKLTSDPRLHEIFQSTGPMVLDERFSLFEPFQDKSHRVGPEISRYSV